MPNPVEDDQDEVWRRATRVRWHQRRLVRAALVLALLVAAAAAIPYPLYVRAETTIIPGERAFVRSQIEGVIVEILVDEGAAVHKGDVLARLDDRILKADRERAHADVKRVQAELARLEAGARPQEIARERAIVAARRRDASFARVQAARSRKMARAGVSSVQSRDDAIRDFELKQKATAEAQASLRLLLAGTRSEDIEAKEAELKRAQAELTLVDLKLGEMIVIRAPIDGRVLTPRFRERLHEQVEAGGLVCEIASTRTVLAEVLVPEREIDGVELGMPAKVKVGSYPGHPFHGTVDFIAPLAEEADGATSVRVVVRLDNPGGQLKQDMTGYGEIDCGNRSLLTLFTRRLVRWVRVRFLI